MERTQAHRSAGSGLSTSASPRPASPWLPEQETSSSHSWAGGLAHSQHPSPLLRLSTPTSSAAFGNHSSEAGSDLKVTLPYKAEPLNSLRPPPLEGTWGAHRETPAPQVPALRPVTPHHLLSKQLLLKADTAPPHCGASLAGKGQEENLEEAYRTAFLTQVTRGRSHVLPQEDGRPQAGEWAEVGAQPLLVPGKGSPVAHGARCPARICFPAYMPHLGAHRAYPAPVTANSQSMAPFPAPICARSMGSGPAHPGPPLGSSVSPDRPTPPTAPPGRLPPHAHSSSRRRRRRLRGPASCGGAETRPAIRGHGGPAAA